MSELLRSFEYVHVWVYVGDVGCVGMCLCMCGGGLVCRGCVYVFLSVACGF